MKKIILTIIFTIGIMGAIGLITAIWNMGIDGIILIGVIVIGVSIIKAENFLEDVEQEKMK